MAVLEQLLAAWYAGHDKVRKAKGRGKSISSKSYVISYMISICLPFVSALHLHYIAHLHAGMGELDRFEPCLHALGSCPALEGNPNPLS
jgi:hypothetical protein